MQINTNNIYDLIIEREKNLTQEIEKRKKRLNKYPEGDLKIIRNRNSYQYYKRNKGEPNGEYIHKDKPKTILELAQKRYDVKYISSAEKELKLLHSFLNHYNFNPAGISESFPWEIKTKMDIAEMTDEEYAIYWQNIEYKPKGIDEGVPFHITARGEQVRSKAEEMIANALFSRSIPYKYEYPVTLYNGEIRHPDFTILNIHTRKVVLLEHLGKVDDPDYISRNLSKLRDYEKTGIYLGEELLITMETQKMPLNTQNIEDFLDKHFGKKK